MTRALKPLKTLAAVDVSYEGVAPHGLLGVRPTSAMPAGGTYALRALLESDDAAGYCALLRQLSHAPEISAAA